MEVHICTSNLAAAAIVCILLAFVIFLPYRFTCASLMGMFQFFILHSVGLKFDTCSYQLRRSLLCCQNSIAMLSGVKQYVTHPWERCECTLTVTCVDIVRPRSILTPDVSHDR